MPSLKTVGKLLSYLLFSIVFVCVCLLIVFIRLSIPLLIFVLRLFPLLHLSIPLLILANSIVSFPTFVGFCDVGCLKLKLCGCFWIGSRCTSIAR